MQLRFRTATAMAAVVALFGSGISMPIAYGLRNAFYIDVQKRTKSSKIYIFFRTCRWPLYEVQE